MGIDIHPPKKGNQGSSLVAAAVALPSAGSCIGEKPAVSDFPSRSAARMPAGILTLSPSKRVATQRRTDAESVTSLGVACTASTHVRRGAFVSLPPNALPWLHRGFPSSSCQKGRPGTSSPRWGWWLTSSWRRWWNSPLRWETSA